MECDIATIITFYINDIVIYNAISMYIYIYLYSIGGKRADVSPDDKRLNPPMDTTIPEMSQIRSRPWGDGGRRVGL